MQHNLYDPIILKYLTQTCSQLRNLQLWIVLGKVHECNRDSICDTENTEEKVLLKEQFVKYDKNLKS